MIPTLTEEVEKVEDDIQILMEGRFDKTEELKDESLTTEERKILNKELIELEDEIDHMEYDVLRPVASALMDATNRYEAAEAQTTIIEEYQLEKQELEKILLSPEDIKRLEIEIENLIEDSR